MPYGKGYNGKMSKKASSSKKRATYGGPDYYKTSKAGGQKVGQLSIKENPCKESMMPKDYMKGMDY